MKKIFNGEVFLVLFLLSGYYKAAFEGIVPVDLTVLFFALSFLCAVGRLYKKQPLYKDMIKPAVVYGLICALMLASLMFATSNVYSMTKTFNFIVITGWSFVGVFLLTNPKNPFLSLKRYLATFLFVGTLMVINSFFSEEGARFVTAFGSNYLSLGKISAIVSLIAAAYLLIAEKEKRMKWVSVVLFVVSAYVLVTSGGRMPVISYLVCLLILIGLGIRISGFRFNDIKIKKKTLIYSFGSILMLPLLINYMLTKGNIFLDRLLLIFNGGGDSALGRADHVGTALKAFTESNLLGLGSGGYLTFTNSMGDRSYPHNMFLEFMAELGIIGLACFIILLTIALTRYFKYFFNRNNFYSVVILLLFTYAFLNAMTSGDFNDNRMLFFFIALLSMSKVLGRAILKEKS